MKPKKSTHQELPEELLIIEFQENEEIKNLERIETYLY